MNSMEVYRSVLSESVPNKKLNVVSYLSVQLWAWKSTVGEDSDPGAVSDWVDQSMCDLDRELNGASMCR
jgi:hypothetical protein